MTLAQPPLAGARSETRRRRAHPLLAIAILVGGVPNAARSDVQPTTAAAVDATARPQVHEWLPSRGRECNGKGRYRRFCQGPRRAPAPYGKAARLARKLGLGERKTMSHLLLKRPKRAWIRAAGGEPKARARRGPHMLWPVENGKLWRGFGRVRRGPKRKKPHRGIDVGAPNGTPIMAASAGLVAYADNGVRGYGNLLAIIHPDGTVATYAHCKAIYVFPGQRVERGQRVADVGHTGIARGSHLHFEYRRGGRARDPIRLFENAPEPRHKRKRHRRRKRRSR